VTIAHAISSAPSTLSVSPASAKAFGNPSSSTVGERRNSTLRPPHPVPSWSLSFRHLITGQRATERVGPAQPSDGRSLPSHVRLPGPRLQWSHQEREESTQQRKRFRPPLQVTAEGPRSSQAESLKARHRQPSTFLSRHVSGVQLPTLVL
jgi:hypothetical protein